MQNTQMTLDLDHYSFTRKQEHSVEVIIELLRKDKRLDWSLYLKENADVASYNMDPVEHYVYFGVKEGRPLPVSEPQGTNERIPESGSPILTVVISHVGDVNFLDKSVRSCIGQSCQKLEVVIFTEADPHLMGLDAGRYQDENIRVLFHKSEANPSSTEYFKQALALAKGEYLLFIASGDFISNNVAHNFEKISSSSPDIIVLKTYVLNASHKGIVVNADASNALNLEGIESLHGDQIMGAAFGTGKLNPTLTNKAYNKNILRKTLQDMDTIPCRYVARCMSLALLNNSNFLKYASDCILYTFSAKSDYFEEENINSLLELVEYLDTCKKILDKNSRQQYVCYFEDEILAFAISLLLDAKSDLKMMQAINYFGIMPVLKYLIHNHANSWLDIAPHCNWNLPLQSGLKSGSRVGIIYPVILNGGAEKILVDFANLLYESGHEVVIFLERASQNESNLQDGIEIRYVGVADYKPDQVVARIQQLYTYLQREHIDIMISHAYWSPALLWETMLFHSLGIPYLVFQHSSFYRRLITKDHNYGILESEAVLRCVEKLFVLSTYDEAYLRNRGIDAVYIHNPVEAGAGQQKKLSHNILFCGRLGEPVKQAAHALQVCRKLADEFPDVKIIFAGDFRHPEDKEKFYASISDLGLEDHVSLRGWQCDLSPLYQECSILLSTSFTESFGLSLAEAQAHGLPGVIYDLPIMPAWENESIISVPQGRPDLAAEQIANIFRNPEAWPRLSEIAVEKSKRFSKELWDEKISWALSSFALFSPWTPVDKDSLRKIILTLSFYACTTPPKF